MTDPLTLIHGDALSSLRTLPDESVQTCVTSPPYWGLRDYGVEGQLGVEHTPEEYVARLVEIFRELKRCLRGDGTLWLNLGDSYAAQRGGTWMPPQTLEANDKVRKRGDESSYLGHRNAAAFGLKHKDLVGIPWMVAFALRGL